jgi:hypothetical protein
MKPMIACVAVATLLTLPIPTSAQEYVVTGGASAYDGYYEYDTPVPPRPIPGVGGRTEIIVTKTRRIITQPRYDAYGPDPVVTTRRIAGPPPIYSEQVPVSAPLPLRRVTKDVVFAPASEHAVIPRRVSVPPAVIFEEHRVETTRRIVRPSSEW